MSVGNVILTIVIVWLGVLAAFVVLLYYSASR